MQKHLFAASIGALAPSFLLLTELQQKFVRELPVQCNAILDSEFLLQPSTIYPHLECMGPLGRQMYLDLYNFDLLLFPMIYSTFLFGALSRIWSRNSAVWMLPILAALADVLENIGMCFLLFKFPTRFEPLETAISVFTRVKWFAVAVSMIFIVLGGFIRLVEAYRLNKAIQTQEKAKLA